MLKILILVVTSSDIDRVFSYVASSDVSSNSWPRRKDLQFLSFQFAKLFCCKVCVPMSEKIMDKRNCADVLFDRQLPQYIKLCGIHNIFVCRSLCPLLYISSGSTNSDKKIKYKQNFKTVWKRELGFSLRLKPFDEG